MNQVFHDNRNTPASKFYINKRVSIPPIFLNKIEVCFGIFIFIAHGRKRTCQLLATATLCLEEKLFIIKGHNKNSLNKRYEIFPKYCYVM